MTGLAGSKGEAARLIKGGGVYLNDARVTDERGRITLDQAIDGRLFVLRKGQRSRHVVRIKRTLFVEPASNHEEAGMTRRYG